MLFQHIKKTHTQHKNTLKHNYSLEHYAYEKKCIKHFKNIKVKNNSSVLIDVCN